MNSEKKVSQISGLQKNENKPSNTTYRLTYSILQTCKFREAPSWRTDCHGFSGLSYSASRVCKSYWKIEIPCTRRAMSSLAFDFFSSQACRYIVIFWGWMLTPAFGCKDLNTGWSHRYACWWAGRAQYAVISPTKGEHCTLNAMFMKVTLADWWSVLVGWTKHASKCTSPRSLSTHLTTPRVQMSWHWTNLSKATSLEARLKDHVASLVSFRIKNRDQGWGGMILEYKNL